MNAGPRKKTMETTIRVAVRNVAGGDQAHYLVVRDGPCVGLRFEIDDEPRVIGRSDEADIDLGDPGVSGRHCAVRLERGRLMVRDLQSTNGTFLDGERVDESTDLPVGASLQVGATLLEHELRSRQEIELQASRANDLDKAAAYVQSLLPAPFSNEWVTTDWRFVPSAKLGGDAFGFHWLDELRFAIYLFDVCGHGTGSALHSVSIASTIRKGALPGVDFGDPAAVLTSLNETFEMDDHAGMYFTAWYGVYDVAARGLMYASGGHPPAILTGAGGEHQELRTPKPPIGLVSGITYESASVAVRASEAGSRLYVYSDGAYEVVDGAGNLWKLAELITLLTTSPGSIEKEAGRIERGVREVMGGRDFEDDFSLVVADFH